MFLLRIAVICLVVAHLGPRAQAGLYCSAEEIAELPSQWRGFLLDQRTLRNAAVKAPGISPLRARYVERAAQLTKSAGERKLSADEAADLGALYVRLGDIEKAVEVLRTAQRLQPNNFRIVANPRDVPFSRRTVLKGDLRLCFRADAQFADLGLNSLDRSRFLFVFLLPGGYELSCGTKQEQARDKAGQICFQHYVSSIPV